MNNDMQPSIGDFLSYHFSIPITNMKLYIFCLIESLTDYTEMFLNSMVHGTLQNKISTSEHVS